MEKQKYNKYDYNNTWGKENLGTVTAKFKKDFVTDFKEACAKMNIKQSDVIRKAMHQIIDESKSK